MGNLDPQGEEIPAGEERTCCLCGVIDHVDTGMRCDHCGKWAHFECTTDGLCDLHTVCDDCAAIYYSDKDGEYLCPVCIDAEEDRKDIQGSIDFARRGQ